MISNDDHFCILLITTNMCVSAMIPFAMFCMVQRFTKSNNPIEWSFFLLELEINSYDHIV